MTQSEQIFQWLEDNKDFFKSEGICKQLGIDKGNFSKYKAAKSIPEKYIMPVIGILNLYGFKEETELTFGGIKIPVKIFEGLGNKAVFVSPPQNAYDSPKIAMIVNDEIGQWEEPKLSTSKTKRIEAILAEKIPEHRNTRLGRLSWQIEQKKRVTAIENEKDE